MERTFSSLYINPILDTLRRQNPTTAFVHEETRNGVFDAAVSQTLYLFIDFKTRDGGEFEAAEEALQPLLDANYLTVYNGSAVVRGPVTIIGTGYTALSAVVAQEPRYIFYDAPLANLSRPGYENITSAVSQIASTSFASNFGRVIRQKAADSEGPLNSTQLELLRGHVSTAHERGILTRYWATPGYPIGTRNAVWRTLVEEGVDLLNVDDLAGAAGFWEGSG
ncbi:hypothetical protein H2201_007295 [Coniosporium apollinis]|uniref:Altered inheritance of mitochondria protein 6 n=2 Tax=Coniosporium TaxID=2810619 RepID=A0ABQ9NK23_9PEZI|nr:hypothetical protein H2199_006159 [Cladosporium sp. JES 115]KAJ9659546.1 hypothetical protein H2201_007295 [Coniosporium apollinis]